MRAFFRYVKALTQKNFILRWLQRALAAFLLCFASFFLMNLFFPLHVHIEYSPLVTASDGTVLKAYLTSDDKWRMMTELDEITPEMRKAIVFKEDKYFYDHPGINPFAVMRALFNNLFTGHRTSGASTITMQVARMLEPRDRTYGNKLIEMFRALQIDMLYPKDEILQMYLNLVPYGGNIEGVKAASLLYLQKTPGVLSLAELTALSVIPNRPTSLRPGINNDSIVQVRNKWLMRFDKAGIFPHAAIEDALLEPFNAFRTAGPDIAPHFCNRMIGQFPGIPIIKTGLQAGMQVKAQKLVSDYVKQLWGLDIHNGAAIVLDNKTHRVLAYVGSADFYDTFDAGQVDGVTAVRSPGSTLKPLLYGMCFDEGIATPHTMISDVPVNFAGYSPGNYDEKFHGNVSVEYALQNSLNVPAVKMLNRIGLDAFEQKLGDCNFTPVTDHVKDLGLSLILGGCGVTLEQLTSLYSAFACQGYYSAPHWLKADRDTERLPVVSDAAAFMVTDILSQLQRPDLPNFYANAKDVPLIAWKTGTSYGRRDAWSIGYDNNYTIGVWIGNFSGTGVPELSGASVATPLLFQLFNSIEKEGSRDWNRMPPDVDFRYVCSVSGKLPSDSCKNVVLDYYIPGVSPSEHCDHLIAVDVSPDEKYSYCKSCLPETGYKVKYYMNYSPEIIAWMQSEHIPYDAIPPHNPECEKVFGKNGPQIVSPVDNLDYYVDTSDVRQIMLSCNVQQDVREVYWYIDDKLLMTGEASSPVFFDPPEGNIKISCSDDKGRNTDIRIHVHYF